MTPRKQVKYAADGKTSLSLVRKRLEWVKKQILASPETYNQSTFCGSECCIGGWLDAKMNGVKTHNRRRSQDIVRKIAQESIGLSQRAWDMPWLFEFDFLGRTGRVTVRGTKAHARAGAKAIDKYLKEIGA